MRGKQRWSKKKKNLQKQRGQSWGGITLCSRVRVMANVIRGCRDNVATM